LSGKSKKKIVWGSSQAIFGRGKTKQIKKNSDEYVEKGCLTAHKQKKRQNENERKTARAQGGTGPRPATESGGNTGKTSKHGPLTGPPRQGGRSEKKKAKKQMINAKRAQKRRWRIRGTPSEKLVR